MQLEPGWLKVRYSLESALDRVFEINSAACVEFDSVLSLDEIQRLGYVRNFPHLTCLCGAISAELASGLARGDVSVKRETHLEGVNFSLLPATCYKVYMGLEGSELSEARIVSCIAKCFRNEDKPLDAYRGFCFTMKEYVCIGNAEDTQTHVENGLEKIRTLLGILKIPYEIETASDPFFDAKSSQAILSRLTPTKREIVFDGHAVSSVNIHRNYFGEKFNITIDSENATTSCVAFGLERWLQMLQDTFETPEKALNVIEAV
jgi:seryl-tRNA synthetase